MFHPHNNRLSLRPLRLMSVITCNAYGRGRQFHQHLNKADQHRSNGFKAREVQIFKGCVKVVDGSDLGRESEPLDHPMHRLATFRLSVALIVLRRWRDAAVTQSATSNACAGMCVDHCCRWSSVYSAAELILNKQKHRRLDVLRPSNINRHLPIIMH